MTQMPARVHFTLDDIHANFDDNTFARGVEYVKKGHVSRAKAHAGRIEGIVRGSNEHIYQLDIAFVNDKMGSRLAASCSCPVAHNCKHAVAVLLTYLDAKKVGPLSVVPAKAEAKADDAKPRKALAPVPKPALPVALGMWLQRIEAATRPKPALLAAASHDPNKAAHSLIYVLAPEFSGKYVTLAVRKARLRPNGEVASTSAVTDLAGLLATRVSYMQDHDEDLVRLFSAMRTGLLSYAGNATEPRGKLGAQLLRELVDRDLLLWTNSWDDAANGLVYPLKAAPLRGARLAWLTEPGSDVMRLGWQFEHAAGAPETQASAAMTVDFILPTDPPWYIDNLSCGELTLTRGKGMSFQELQALVAQAPPLAAKDKLNLSAVLLARGLHELLPMPVQMKQKVLDNIKPTARLLMGSLHTSGSRQSQVWHDFAQLSFDYDGVPIGFDPSRQVVRHTDDGMEVIERDFAAEQNALAALQTAGMTTQEQLHGDAVPAAPLLALPGVFQLPSPNDWLRFTRDTVPQLAALGWRIDKTPDYRYDVISIDDWYADVDANVAENAASPWFDLELGIIVNQQRVPLLPVLVQLIRGAPQDFNPAALAAHADTDQLLATVGDGVRVALPWGRIKPILGTLGELYFNDKTGASMRLSK
ncbi:MAG TPA: SWIM zinc finger family protein, partial [Burkholderiaceae bacterium]